MNDINVPAERTVKICSNCLRILPIKYYLRDNSREDRLACNCNACLFPRSTFYKNFQPELWEEGRFKTADPLTVPVLAGKIKGKIKGTEASRKKALPSPLEPSVECVKPSKPENPA